MAILDRLIASSIGIVPKALVRRIAWRYVAGETLDDAVETGQALGDQQCCCTFDLLGEFVTEDSQADRSERENLSILDRIEADGLDGNVSVKLTGLGLKLDEESCFVRLRNVVKHARDLGNSVRIDMEDSSCTDATIRLYRRLREEEFDNVGIVLQAYLRRTVSDVEKLVDLRPNYRICKGIYVEPEAIAFKDPEEIRVSYRRALAAMLDAGSYVGIATHDPVLVEAGREAVLSRGLSPDAYEFQMLLGVAEKRRRQLVGDGHRVRVYVPYGRDWYAYSVRRLKENPQIGRHVFLGLFRRD